MPPTLEIYRGPTVVARVRLRGRAITVGRGEGVDVDLAEVAVDETPAVVEPTTGGRWRLRIGTSLSARRDAILLRNGEAVPLGGHSLVVRDDTGDGERHGGNGGTAQSLVAPTRLAQAHEVAAQAGGAAASLYLEYAGKRWPVGRRPLTVGTAADCDVVVEDATVSRHHCCLEPRGELLFVRDLGSTNGTRVDEVAVLEAMTRPEARLRIGNTCLHLVARERPVVTPGPDRFHGMVGTTPKMRSLYRLLERIAATDAPVLISGETGTGKELAARAIHEASGRRGGPLVVINCGAIPEELIESELFGHEKGAFTHAVATRDGAFAQADGGTLFLDEVGELPLAVQATLLRVLEDRTFKRVGGNRELTSDFRIVAATNLELTTEVREGRFRQDLFFRLYVAPVTLPPLADRLDDLPALVAHLLQRDATAGAPPPEVAPEAIDLLRRHRWPGNIRELRNVLARAQLLNDGSRLGPESFTFLDEVGPATPGIDLAHLTLQEVERMTIAAHLAAHQGQRRAAAASLGIATSTLYEKLKRYPELGSGGGRE